MTTTTGSSEHKKELCEGLIRAYQENIWKDELYLMQLAEVKAEKETEIKSIEAKIAAKTYKTKNEGEKAKFVAERELKAIEKEIAAVTEKVQVTWPKGIRRVEEYMNS